MAAVLRLPPRAKVKVENTWDLSPMYESDAAWEREFQKLDKLIAGFGKFRGKLGKSAQTLAACLAYDCEFKRRGDRLGGYAQLKLAADQTDGTYQGFMARFTNLTTRAAQAASFIQPEILAIPRKTFEQFRSAKQLQPFKRVLERIMRLKPYTLPPREEEILALQGEMAGTTAKAFRQLLDADLKWSPVKDERGALVELSNANVIQLLVSPVRKVRKNAFQQYYAQFKHHENTLAAMLSGSIHKDVYYAQVRGYSTSLDAALFPGNVPRSVYENLITAVRQHLPAVHRYFDMRRRKMKLQDIHQYDTYAPIHTDLTVNRNWNQAVNLVMEALQPLGDEYCRILEQGLTTARWCDRYSNQGKSSGAFSRRGYDHPPYILMNYHPDVFNDVFTLAHEAGHSMHSWLAARHQPYQYFNYTTFVAEVASTFNEELLSHCLLKSARDERQRAYVINRELDYIRVFVIRQTMFAEFEKTTHAMAEAGDPLTAKAFQDVHRQLLATYNGPEFALDDELPLECLRIPHLYRAFYLFQYATGLAAAIALSQRVLRGGQEERNDYLTFLQSGGSKDPLDLLRDAGVDMEQPAPVATALQYFGQLVDELDELI
jgi:oligoendopeptidase F